MKTQKAMSTRKEKTEALSNELYELADEELDQVNGGRMDFETLEWLARNQSELIARAEENGTYGNLRDLMNGLGGTSFLCTLEGTKRMIGDLISLDGLD